MTKNELYQQILRKKSYLCVGLDTDIEKLPKHLPRNSKSVLEFNKRIIDATAEYAVAYKPNVAFYEAMGSEGWEVLQQTFEYIPNDIFTIADAKRGDIGNTADQYAKAFFETMNVDSITITPYVGEDCISAFTKYKDKWVILLALTSNPGSSDFQLFGNDEEQLYQRVLTTAQKWASPENLMFVVGATRTEYLSDTRRLAPDNFFLVPGVGAQGGSLEEVSKNCMNDHCGILINSTRSIIYASSGKDYADAAANEARKLQQEMSNFL